MDASGGGEADHQLLRHGLAVELDVGRALVEREDALVDHLVDGGFGLVLVPLVAASVHDLHELAVLDHVTSAQGVHDRIVELQRHVAALPLVVATVVHPPAEAGQADDVEGDAAHDDVEGADLVHANLHPPLPIGRTTIFTIYSIRCKDLD